MQTQRNGTSRRGKPWRLLRMARVAQVKRPRRGRRAEAVCVGTPAGVGLGRSASRSLALRYEVGRLWPRPLLVLRRPWKVRKDEFASRTAIRILVAEIDKVLFAKATPCLNT